MSSLRIKLAAFVAVLCPIGVFAATASAAPATVYQMSCSINGISGSGIAVQLSNGSFALTSCHTSDRVVGLPPIKSGTCTTLENSLNVCAGNKQ